MNLSAGLRAALGQDAGAQLPFVASGFCSAAQRADVEIFFRPRIAQFSGGPWLLDNVLETIGICFAVKNVQEPNVPEFLRSY